MKRLFPIATDDEIKKAQTTDIYFVRTKQILEAKGASKKIAHAEVTTGPLPQDWNWGMLCGVEEAATLLQGLSITVRTMPEGTLFQPNDHRGYRVPVMTLEGPYGDFCLYETPLLGILCHNTGIATMAARIRKAAGNAELLSFGIRRAHPALSPLIDRAAYLAGFDQVSSLSGARLIGKDPAGTMPHSLIVALGSQTKAWKAFDDTMSKTVPRIALVDTYYDEKAEAIMAAETLGKRLNGVRLDTPSSRRGEFAQLIREVRWELDIRGYRKVKIYASGGINETNIREYAGAGVDGFGVGTAVSSAPTVDFALDIVELDGKPVAKRGKLGGAKDVWRCPKCLLDKVVLRGESPGPCPNCKSKMNLLLVKIIEKGRLLRKLPSVDEIRAHVLRQLSKIQASGDRR